MNKWDYMNAEDLLEKISYIAMNCISTAIMTYNTEDQLNTIVGITDLWADISNDINKAIRKKEEEKKCEAATATAQ